METVVLAIHLILAFLLIGLVLIQRSEGGGLTSQQGAVAARSAATALTKLTWVLAAGFFATSIALTVIAASKAADGSVADQISTEAPATEGAPATGGLTGDLTAPVEGTAPATAPAAPAPAQPSN